MRQLLADKRLPCHWVKQAEFTGYTLYRVASSHPLPENGGARELIPNSRVQRAQPLNPEHLEELTQWSFPRLSITR